MRYSTKLSDAAHILVLIALNPYDELTSQQIARSIATNPGFVRQIMSMLRKSGLIVSITGHAKPALSRPASEISLLDIYRAVEGDKPLLHLDIDTNPDCGVGIGIQSALKDYYAEIQELAEQRMKHITLQNIVDTYKNKAGIDDISTLINIWI
ncbi:MAG: Rrf2 family transcriptional regulator [Eubacteriales bacterium]|nr:Rrf2 family transcriptional regulator [Eubacteriales bacterium]